MRYFRAAALLLPFLLAACGDSGQQNASYAPVSRSEVSPITYSRMIHGQDLALDDIKNLTRAGVNDDTTLRYLRHQRTVYHLTPEDVGALRQAGVSREVVDFMLQTPHLYTNYQVAMGSGFYIPYYDDYWGPPYPNYPDPSRQAR
jgi:hypothetical protein